MENLEIKITTGGAYGDHIFIGCDISIELEIAGTEYYGSFQTGHSYDHNDYSYPSNNVEVYDDDEILSALDRSCGDYDEFKEDYPEINEDDFLIAYSALEELRDAAQSEVDEVLREAEEELNSDKHVYVLVTEREIQDEEVGNLIQCSPQYSCRFDDDIDADVFIEEQQDVCNLAHKTSVKTGVEMYHEGFSNWKK